MLVTVNCSRFAFVVVTTEHVPLPSVVHIATFPNRRPLLLCKIVRAAHSTRRGVYLALKLKHVEHFEDDDNNDNDSDDVEDISVHGW